MLSLKPIYLHKYLDSSPRYPPKGIQRQFYLSYEDALWHILTQKRVAKGSVILVPEFFCGDVEDNIQNHGYCIQHYHVSKLLITSEAELIKMIRQYHPSVVVIFHAIGISNKLLSSTNWINNLAPDSIIIEDSVHRIIDPPTISLKHPNHLVIDSLRKVMPLQGSVVYGSTKFLDFPEPPLTQEFLYRLQVTMLWVLMNFLWFGAQSVANTRLSVVFAKAANHVMGQGYALIGDRVLPAKGTPLFNYLHRFVNPRKIATIKDRQVRFYEQQLRSLDPDIFTVPFYRRSQRGLLLAYPLILNIRHATKVLDYLHQHGLMLRFELDDSVWSRHHKVIYLPLGPHLSFANLHNIARIISSI